MDKKALHVDIWTTLQVDHMTTLRRPLDHRGHAYGLTRFACLFFVDKTGKGLVPPWMPDGEGLELGESFALPRRNTVGSFPLDAGRSQSHRIGG